MPALVRPEGVACRACGATRARPGPGGALPGICGNCWNWFLSGRRRAEKDEPANEDEFNAHLARKLLVSLARIERTGLVGRCEAFSGCTYLDSDGYQCARSATTMREGRRVCASHRDSTYVVFIEDDRAADPYFILEQLLRSISEADAKFAEAVRRAAGVEIQPTLLSVAL